ncbi:WhiB family transcriptional regulator [Micromonospora sp. RV43]|uniref:WhiB family transcriptional regulator n=1 Tax=Micromonospora sp. RV43 TaxID=1661387 RepID=UPI00064C4168|nr:WhiB family transcriptional regulator [Micromonospora sp. RV43]
MPATSVTAPIPRGPRLSDTRETDSVLQKRIQTRGLCVPTGKTPQVNADEDPWFPNELSGKAAAAAARKACRNCPVRSECLELALREERTAANVYGIRGGRSATERKALLKRRFGQGGGAR